MPELPELEVLKFKLTDRIVGLKIDSVKVNQPLVFRCLLDDFRTTLTGAKFTKIERRGKFLILKSNHEKAIVLNLMLSGRLQLTDMKTKVTSKTCFQITFESGLELRYFDVKKMGRIYFEAENGYSNIPQFADLGAEPLDPEFTYAAFKERIKKHRGMIKNVITNQRFVAGIGNAYSDEILFVAGILPLKKASQLDENGRESLYKSIQTVLKDSIRIINKQIGDDIHLQNRDFMLVHNKGGEPCPVCGTKISELKPDGKITNFCRSCQQ